MSRAVTPADHLQPLAVVQRVGGHLGRMLGQPVQGLAQDLCLQRFASKLTLQFADAVFDAGVLAVP